MESDHIIQSAGYKLEFELDPGEIRSRKFYWCWKQRGLEKLTRQRARFLVEENANLVSKHTFQ